MPIIPHTVAAPHGEGLSCPQPSWRRAAVLIRGQAFRVHGGGTLTRGCMSEREEHSRSQRAAWRALLEQVVRPLEACGTLVEVMVTECSSVRGCPAVMDPIHGLPSLFGSRLVANQTSECESRDQGSNMRTALNTALAAACCVGDGDLLLITRHDIVFTRPITAWSRVGGANFSKFNFLSVCDQDRGPESCVADAVLSMPAAMVSKFERLVLANHYLGGLGCFSNTSSPNGIAFGNGHGCWPLVKRHVTWPDAPGLLVTPEVYRPRVVVREENPISHFV